VPEFIERPITMGARHLDHHAVMLWSIFRVTAGCRPRLAGVSDGGRLDMFQIPRAALALAAVIGCSVTANAADPYGSWLTEESKATIRVPNCGGAICGTITALKEPIDPDTGKPRVDKNNPEAGKRTRPMIGVQIILGMKPNGPDKWSGQLYNAEDGKTYNGNI